MDKLLRRSGIRIMALVCAICICFQSAGFYVRAEEAADVISDAGIEESMEASDGQSFLAVLYMCDEFGVRAEASYDSETIINIQTGQSVFIEDVKYIDNDDEAELWDEVSFYYNDVLYRGYIPNRYLACSDERFPDFLEQKNLPVENNSDIQFFSADGIELYSAYSDIAQFPESYQGALTELKNAHPNWVFVPMNTGIDFKTAVSMEMQGGRSLVYKTFPEYTKLGAYDDGNWYYATEAILKYYMDPRNFLKEAEVFQFELLTYNESYHTQWAVENFLTNTFMRGDHAAPGTGSTFANIFWEVGRSENVSPFHLAARVYQEQGLGDSALISGNYSGYEGYYNYFNVGASGQSTTAVIESGLAYARDKGWNNAYASISGGAKVISQNYIKRGQDTVYLEKFNVTTNNTYNHQYMQNIAAPAAEGAKIKKLYEGAGSLDNTFVFKIPVYANMPKNPCPMPTSSLTVDMDEVVSFVERLYACVLNREAEASGRDFWAGQLANGSESGVKIGYEFIFDMPEFGQRNLSDGDFLDVMYQTFMDREADAGGKNYWLELLGVGVNREYVYGNFVCSQEYAKRCEICGIHRGEVNEIPKFAEAYNAYRNKNIGVTKYVVRGYTKILKRNFDISGVEYWCGKIIRGESRAEDAAKFFVQSEEFKKMNSSDAEYVKVLYNMFMDREADAAGLNYWVGLLENKSRSRDDVLEGFAASKEFSDILKSYGIL